MNHDVESIHIKPYHVQNERSTSILYAGAEIMRMVDKIIVKKYTRWVGEMIDFKNTILK